MPKNCAIIFKFSIFVFLPKSELWILLAVKIRSAFIIFKELLEIIKATDPFGVTFNKLVIPNDIDAPVECHFRQNNIEIEKI